jgi:hypothetical protein
MTRPDHTAVPPADVIAAAEQPRPEQVLRRLLAYRCAGPLLYADEGELLDNSARPWIDFKRDSVDAIETKLGERARAEGAAPTAAQTAGLSDGYGKTAFGFTFAGVDLTDGDKRLAALMVRALGTDHPAMDDFVSLVFRARPSHASRAALAASRDAESATSGATSAAKVELELPEDTVRRLWQEAFEIALNEAGFGIGNGDVAHMKHPIVFARLVAKALKPE